MLDLGWQEFIVIALVTILVVGPKEIPRVIRTVREVMKKLRRLAGEFHSVMDDVAREADLDELKNEVGKIKDGSSDWTRAIDPDGEITESLKETKAEFDDTRSALDREAAPSPSATTPRPEIKEEPLKAGDPRLLPEARESVKKAGAKKSAAKKAPRKKAGAKKSPTKKTNSKPAAKKSVSRKSGAKKSEAKKSGVDPS